MAHMIASAQDVFNTWAGLYPPRNDLRTLLHFGWRPFEGSTANHKLQSAQVIARRHAEAIK